MLTVHIKLLPGRHRILQRAIGLVHLRHRSLQIDAMIRRDDFLPEDAHRPAALRRVDRQARIVQRRGERAR